MIHWRHTQTIHIRYMTRSYVKQILHAIIQDWRHHKVPTNTELILYSTRCDIRCTFSGLQHRLGRAAHLGARRCELKKENNHNILSQYTSTFGMLHTTTRRHGKTQQKFGETRKKPQRHPSTHPHIHTQTTEHRPRESQNITIHPGALTSHHTTATAMKRLSCITFAVKILHNILHPHTHHAHSSMRGQW